MPRPRLRCPHCSEIDWSRAPELRATLALVAARSEMTSRHVADAGTGVSIANASNRMRALEDLEFVTRTTAANPTGGVMGVFRITKLGRDALQPPETR